MKLVGVVFMSVGLVACPFQPLPPTEVPYDTDPRILRGVWVGEVFNYPSRGTNSPVQLDLTAQTLPAGAKMQEYEVSGTIKLGSDSPLSLTGKTTSVFEIYIRPQTSYLPSTTFDADVSNAQGRKLWRLRCNRFFSEASYYCGLEPVDESVSSLGFPMQPKP